MSWVTLLWAGLLAVAIPLWIHRIQRRGRVRVPFSSIALVRPGRERAKRKWSRRRSWLLWLRMAALFSLALALATAPLAPEGGTPGGTSNESLREQDPDVVSEPVRLERSVSLALSVEADVEPPLRTALTLLEDSLGLGLGSGVVSIGDPVDWSLRREMSGLEACRETFLLQGWPTGRDGTERWPDWIRSGGHLVVIADSGTDLISMNRWFSSAGLDLRAEPARQGDRSDPESMARWIGDRLFGRSVPSPRIFLPDSPSAVIWSAVEGGRVLHRSAFGDPLVCRISFGDGWLTLAGFSWQEGASGWLYHPLFPFVLEGLLIRPDRVVENETRETMEPVDGSLNSRVATRPERTDRPGTSPGKREPEGRAWIGWLSFGMALFLIESLAGRSFR